MRRILLPFCALALAALLLAGVLGADGPQAGDGSGPIVGPDVTVYSLTDISNYGAFNGIRAYAVGTTSCNVGSEPVNWCDNGGGCGPLDDRQHPVIAQNLYRLKEGRFEQLGMSWLKHGFLSTNSFASDCQGPAGQTCQFPPLGGDQLGVGCTDTYGSGLNGSRPLGLRSEVNPATGFFPYPRTVVGTNTEIDQRLQVDETDLDPALNPLARYWVEGHYIADNDALANNAANNASYREVSVGPAPGFDLFFVGGTVREQAAIAAWPAVDPTVTLAHVAFGNPVEHFQVARKVTEPVPGSWHFEYAVRNVNSDRAARAFTVDFPAGTTIANPGFHDVDHHSGEPYSTTDWTVAIGPPERAVWTTDTFTVDPDANALRWATMFSFWFDADAPPEELRRVSLILFKPGAPCRVEVAPAADYVFHDDFETGDTCAWSSTVPG